MDVVGEKRRSGESGCHNLERLDYRGSDLFCQYIGLDMGSLVRCIIPGGTAFLGVILGDIVGWRLVLGYSGWRRKLLAHSLDEVYSVFKCVFVVNICLNCAKFSRLLSPLIISAGLITRGEMRLN